MMKTKIALTAVALAGWLSSWVAVPLDTMAVWIMVGCGTALAVAWYFSGRVPAVIPLVLNVTIWIGCLWILCGAMLVLEVLSNNWPLVSVVLNVLGWWGFLRLLWEVLVAPDSWRLSRNIGSALLIALSFWSWYVAAGIFLHRGAEEIGSSACILKSSNNSRYNTHVTSLWQMRPTTIGFRYPPEGRRSYIYTFHAVLVVPGGTPAAYNWSMLSGRFEGVRDFRGVVSLPETCPRMR